jgi:hypothetical protein
MDAILDAILEFRPLGRQEEDTSQMFSEGYDIAFQNRIQALSLKFYNFFQLSYLSN